MKTLRALLVTALLALAAPLSAQDHGVLWTLPSGRVDAECQTINPQEKFNRSANLVRRADLLRMPLLVTSNGRFSPGKGNVLLQCGHTYASIFAQAERHGFRVVLDLIIYPTGRPDGPGYHRGKPILNPGTLTRFSREVLSYIDSKHPGLEVIGWQLGNEVDYAPSGGYSHESYWRAYEALMDVFPRSWRRFSGGNSGLEKKGGELTLNGFLASTGKAKRHGIELDVHCNRISDSDCREELTELPRKYKGVKVAMFEDNPVGDSNRAKPRAKLCKSAGATVCSGLIIRDSGRPPLTEGCSWSTSGSKPPRWHVGVEGCYRCWQDGSVCRGRKTARNWQELDEAAKVLGTKRPGKDLPNTLEGEDPGDPPSGPPGPPSPPPPGDAPPGMHQFCAFINLSIKARGLPGESPEDCKADPVRRALFETLMRRLGVEQ